MSGRHICGAQVQIPAPEAPDSQEAAFFCFVVTLLSIGRVSLPAALLL